MQIIDQEVASLWHVDHSVMTDVKSLTWRTIFYKYALRILFLLIVRPFFDFSFALFFLPTYAEAGVQLPAAVKEEDCLPP